MCGFSQVTGPLRRGRPHGPSKDHDIRKHPYRRGVQRGTIQLKYCSSVQNGNGHLTTTLSKGVEGAKMNGSAVHAPKYEDAFEKLYSAEPEGQTLESEDNTWGESHLADRIVWAPGKQSAQLAIRLQRLMQEGGSAVAVRVSEAVAKEIQTLLPDAKYNSQAKAISVTGSKKQERLAGTVAIIAEDSSDSIAEEALVASTALGCYTYKLATTDGDDSFKGSVPNISAAQSADVVIVVARKEAALPMVVAGMVEAPVIAVPAGESQVPLAAASWPGVSVVGRDNGLAAILLAHRILKAAARLHSRLSAAAP